RRETAAQVLEGGHDSAAAIGVEASVTDGGDLASSAATTTWASRSRIRSPAAASRTPCRTRPRRETAAQVLEGGHDSAAAIGVEASVTDGGDLAS
ncbi:hypothetical protein CTI14_62910, partial [Methylobacterium radiotolerans]